MYISYYYVPVQFPHANSMRTKFILPMVLGQWLSLSLLKLNLSDLQPLYKIYIPDIPDIPDILPLALPL